MHVPGHRGSKFQSLFEDIFQNKVISQYYGACKIMSALLLHVFSVNIGMSVYFIQRLITFTTIAYVSKCC